jgi:hypothetical protein
MTHVLVRSNPLQTEPTLHDFVTRLLSDASARELFDSDPAGALSGAGLSDVTPQDVMDAIPLVLDLASASGEGFAFQGGIAGAGTDALGGGVLSTPLGDSGYNLDAGLNGVDLSGGTVTADEAQGQHFELSAGPDGLSGLSTFWSGLGEGSFDLGGGLDGATGGGDLQLTGLDALGLDADAIGRGGDAVTGTVASYLTDGADTLAGALTDGAGVLGGGMVGGADMAGDMITDGAAQLADAVQDPTSVQLPDLNVPGLADLPTGLPVDVPAGLPAGLPAAPALPGLSGLPGLPALPDLGDLPVNLPHLPVDLPATPALPALSDAPALPSVHSLDVGLDTVHDAVNNLTDLGDLTNGVDNHLPFGH